MKFFVLALGLAFLALLAAGALGSWRFARRAAELTRHLLDGAAPVDVSDRLPNPVRGFALRADANPADLARAVQFTQEAEMQLKPYGPWLLLEAEQTVATSAPGFLWQARRMLGPVPKLQVIDGFIAGRGQLRVRLLGLLRVAHGSGPAVDRAEMQRYLAELPWAPDAILGNPALRWQTVAEDWVEVQAEVAGGPVEVRFRFDEAGDIVEVFAAARDATDDAGRPVQLPWQGYFRDYRMVGGRRIPTEAEVGYLRPEGFRPYWQGRITSYEALH